MSNTITIVTHDNKDLLNRVAAGVFDLPVNDSLLSEFLSDPRHHLVVAIDDAVVVGMASAVHYVHPDKPPQLWINEMAVAPLHRGRGVGKELINALLNLARQLNCTEAWVLTDRSNPKAMKVYAGCGGIESPRDQVMFSFPLH